MSERETENMIRTTHMKSTLTLLCVVVVANGALTPTIVSKGQII